MALMGATDPRLDAHGRIDLRLNRQLRGYSRADPPSARVKPIPVGLLQNAVHSTTTSASPTPLIEACTDMSIIAFFFLMCPGEYAVTTTESHPFHLRDVELFCGARRLDLTATPLPDLSRATFVILESTTLALWCHPQDPLACSLHGTRASHCVTHPHRH